MLCLNIYKSSKNIDNIPKIINISQGEKKLHVKNCGNAYLHNILEGQAKITKKHAKDIGGVGGGSNRLEQYRIPEKLIRGLLELCEE